MSDIQWANQEILIPIVSNQYAVVCFLPRNDNGADEIDLIPFTWLKFTENEKTQCYYPNTGKELAKRVKYLQKVTPPKSS